MTRLIEIKALRETAETSVYLVRLATHSIILKAYSKIEQFRSERLGLNIWKHSPWVPDIAGNPSEQLLIIPMEYIHNNGSLTAVDIYSALENLGELHSYAENILLASNQAHSLPRISELLNNSPPPEEKLLLLYLQNEFSDQSYVCRIGDIKREHIIKCARGIVFVDVETFTVMKSFFTDICDAFRIFNININSRCGLDALMAYNTGRSRQNRALSSIIEFRDVLVTALCFDNF